MSWVLMSIVGGGQDASGRGNAVSSVLMYHNKRNVWGGKWLETSPEYRLGQALKGFESSGNTGLELYIRNKR